MPRRNFAVLASLLVFSLFCWVAASGSVAAPRGPLRYLKGFPGDGQDYENLSLLIDVMQLVDQNYVHELSKEEKRKFVEQAIESGLHTLDEHSSFLSQREYRSFKKQNEGSFGGIGVTLSSSRDSGKLTIVTPIVGSPAYKAEVKPGDTIEKINGVSTEGLTSDEAVERITGKIGEPVTLTLRSRGSSRTRDVTLVRDLIEVESVLGDQRDAQQKWDFLYDKKDRIGYVRLAGFGRKTVDELKAALAHLKQQGVRGLVLDLRGNPGGSLTAAVGVANLFLSQGRIVSVEGRTRAPEVYDADPKETLLPAAGHPMVVLVNEGSASASEIVAAALQDGKRAVIMGERSYGKGSVQSMIEMENGSSALKVTIAKYMRPSGKNIHRFPGAKEEAEWGVRPDVLIKQTPLEEVDYWLARRDRDIVRKETAQAELREQAASLAGPAAAALQAGSPLLGPFAVVDLAAAVDRLPVPPRNFRDKALDQAIEYLRKEQDVRTAAKPS